MRDCNKKKIPTISFIYVEPTTFYEYMLDISKKAKETGLKIIVHYSVIIAKKN